MKKPMAKATNKTKLAPVNPKPVVMNKSPMKKANKVPKGRRTKIEDTPV